MNQFEQNFVLELLHAADQEASSGAISDAPRFSAVLNGLRAQDLGDDGLPDNTLTLSSGDAFIPGVFFDASEEAFGAGGIADIQIQNELGFEAIALGNHEFDFGTDVLAGLIDGSAGAEILGADFEGALFPYLSANVDVTTDANLAPLDTAGGRAPEANTITSSVVIDVNGEDIGVVGATTPTLATISNAGDVTVGPEPFDANPTPEQLDALAAEIQLEVEALLAANPNMNKVVLLAHMQQLPIEQALAERLADVDVIVAGGSNTRLFDEDDRPRDGDSVQGEYPFFTEDAAGEPIAVVNTDGSYKYVGRLVIDFDENGNIIPDSYDATLSGAFATDEEGVIALDAEDLVDPEVQAIVDEIEDVIVAREGNVFGLSDVFLNGNRSGVEGDPSDPDGVRTQETNLGNLTADANLAVANELAQQLGESDPILVSIKNGGGIRASIGEAIVPPGGTEAVRGPNAAIFDSEGNLVKPEGGISQNDIQTALAFNNGLTLLTLTREELVEVLEHGLAALPNVGGQFLQVSGVTLSFDPDRPAGSRIETAAIVDADGNEIAPLVDNGQLVGDASETFRIVTLDFLADGGDGYPFPDGATVNRIDLTQVATNTPEGEATFADTGSEQDALAEFLAANFATPETAFDEADAGVGEDARIVNLDVQEGGPDGPVPTLDLQVETVAEFVGEGGSDAAEVVAHEDGVLYVTNGAQGRIDVFEIPEGEASTTVTTPDRTIDLTGLDGFDGVQSVAVANGVVAVAVSRAPEEREVFGETFAFAQPGFVALFDAETLELLSTVDVGNLPDQLTFAPDGTTLLVAGEGEKNDDSDNDDNPLGTVAIIDVTDPGAPVSTLLDFTAFNGLEDAARTAGIRLQEGVSFGEDVEPEYIAVSPDGTTAFVALQENNALAKIDLATSEVVDVVSLGTGDFSATSQLDANDDGQIDIRNFPSLVGLRMPDAIVSFEVAGETYVATANEGDSRDFDEARVGELAEEGLLDEALVAELTDAGLLDDDPDTDIGLERLEVSTIDGDTDGDGDIDVLHTFSSRSFSIFDADGELVFDSGADIETFIAANFPERFNDDDGTADENRSDAKGPEPEAITVGEVGDRTYLFVGLERDSGIVIYDVTRPSDAFFVTYIEPKFTDVTPDDEVARQSPEILAFIPAEESTTGNAQLAASYEVSGTTIVYDIEPSAPRVAIGDIQGAQHRSPLEGEEVRTSGIVTAVDSNGFYLQDAYGDGDDRTSDAVFVFTDDAPSVAVGDEIVLQGTVSEFTPGGEDTRNLSTTQLSDITDLIVIARDQALPEAVTIGGDGRLPPTETIDDDAFTSFDPSEDGIDFFESLEGMLVTAEDLVAVSGTNRFGEIFAVVDGGEGTTGLSERGTLNISPDDFNPEKIQIDEDSGVFDFDFPSVDVGAELGDVTGVVGYGFGNFEIIPTEDFTPNIVPAELEPEIVDEAGDDDFTIAAYNVLNLDPNDADGDTDLANGRFDTIAGHIVTNLQLPDVVALQEIQDNSGSDDDGVVSAEETLQTLVDAIEAESGVEYAFIDNAVITDDASGGQPVGNIRTAYLYNPDRVDLVDDSVTSIAAEGQATDPENPFFDSRLPLVATFAFEDEEVTVVNNHFSSKGGSAPILGVEQPFDQRQEDPSINGSLDERRDQAEAVKSFVDEIVDEDPDANVVVLGDLNEFEFVSPVLGLGGSDFTNLIDTLPEDERYSFIFQGNSQTLDHILVSDNLVEGSQFDTVHVNSEFAETPERGSDHDPVWAALDLGGASEDVLIA